jgi:hypothetical protein
VDGEGHVELEDIIEAIQAGHVRITDHAYEDANADRLKFERLYSEEVVRRFEQIRAKLERH